MTRHRLGVFVVMASSVTGTLAFSTMGHAAPTVQLNTYSDVFVSGDGYGPNKLGKDTGAGIMDTFGKWKIFRNPDGSFRVVILATYTRSANKPNNDNSYMQGGAAVAVLTEKGVQFGDPLEIPERDGQRAYMRPTCDFAEGEDVIFGASSEDNGVNDNPQPIAARGKLKNITGANPDARPSVELVPITNGNITGDLYYTNLIQQALADGVTVQNPDNQRGSHTLMAIGPNNFVAGMQYNNQAQEALNIVLGGDGSMHVKWLKRYSNTAQHSRPVVTTNGAFGYIAAVEANNQPAEIGARVTKFNLETGEPIVSKIVVRSAPGQNRYVSEPIIEAVAADNPLKAANCQLVLNYGMSSKARDRNGNNGHGGGNQISNVTCLDPENLALVGDPLVAAAPYARHAHMYLTAYGPEGRPAVAMIGGSSTGTGPGMVALLPITDTGISAPDPSRTYPVSLFSDVANVQARGKHNPNNQAKGFIKGLGNIPNPGYRKPDGFMPQVSAFSLSLVTGYSGPEAAARGLKNSMFLSLVPATWDPNVETVPGIVTTSPGKNPDGTGSLPVVSGEETGTEGTGGAKAGNRVGGLDGAEGGCACTTVGARPAPDWRGLALAGLGLWALIRRRRPAEATKEGA